MRLSRVTSLDGLVIEGFDEKYIYCNEAVTDALNSMPPFISDEGTSMDTTESSVSMTIMMHNIQGLHAHYMDLKCNSEMMKANFICLTETWTEDEMQYDMQSNDFKSYHQPRCLSYVVAERSSLPDSSSGVSSRMWVRIPAVTLVSLSKTLNHNCFSPPRG